MRTAVQFGVTVRELKLYRANVAHGTLVKKAISDDALAFCARRDLSDYEGDSDSAHAVDDEGEQAGRRNRVQRQRVRTGASAKRRGSGTSGEPHGQAFALCSMPLLVA